MSNEHTSEQRSTDTPNQAMQEARMQELGQRIRELDYAYYVAGTPQVSDEVYDGLLDELRSLEEHYGVLEASPTSRVASDMVSEFPEVEHRIPVLSLDKAYSVDEVLSWAQSTSPAASKAGGSYDRSALPDIIAEEKLDGVSLVLYYEKGILKQGLTRGNGWVGNDITANAKTIRSIPLQLQEKVDIAVRGEVFLKKSHFKALCEQGDIDFANPRNTVAGSLRRKKVADLVNIPLSFLAYQLVVFDEQGQVVEDAFASEEESLLALKAWGLPVNEWHMIPHARPEDIASYLEKAIDEREALDYDIDGIVFKCNEHSTQYRLGYTGHHPRWAVAWKFASPQALSTVVDIEVQVGRTGRITPVAVIEPVALGGVEVSHSSLHNQGYIDALDLNCGDLVAISRRGDVIPAVEEVVEKLSAGSYQLPSHCPSCGAATETRGSHLFCLASDCPAQLLGKLIFFAGKGQLDIDGLGAGTLTSLFELGIIRQPLDLFALDAESFAGIPGWKEKKIAKVLTGISKARERSFADIIVAYGIAEVGPSVVESLIAAGYDSYERLIAEAEAGGDGFALIDGIGQRVQESLVSTLCSQDSRDYFAGLARLGFAMESSRTEADEASITPIFAGETWCVTGSFARFKPRDKATEIIKKAGGSIASSITKKTTHLLAGEGAGSKLKKAEALGVIILSEAEFCDRIASIEKEL